MRTSLFPFTSIEWHTWEYQDLEIYMEDRMKTEVKIIALDVAANIYVVVDYNGNSIGTGTKEVCEVLAQIASAGNSAPFKKSQSPTKGSNDNIHSAITI